MSINNRQPTSDKRAEYSPRTKSLEIVEVATPYIGDQLPDLEKEKISHYKTRRFRSESTLHRFVLLTEIGVHHYIIQLSESSFESGAFQISFKTTEYEYARTQQGDDENEKLFLSIARLVEECSKFVEGGINTLLVSPADASYSVEEINSCIEAILNLQNNELTREEIKENYLGYRVLDLYEELAGKKFDGRNFRRDNKAMARSRYFMAAIRKYFPDWEVIYDQRLFSDFKIHRKQNQV